MKLRELFKVLAHIWLILTPDRRLLEVLAQPQRPNALDGQSHTQIPSTAPIVIPPIQNDIPSFVNTVQTYQGLDNVQEHIVQDLFVNYSENFYLDDPTWVKLYELFDYVSGRKGKEALANTNAFSNHQIQEAYLLHVDAYLEIYQQHRLPPLKFTAYQAYKLISKAYSHVYLKSQNNSIKNKFYETYNSFGHNPNQRQSPPESFISFSNHILSSGDIDVVAFETLINDANASPLQKNYEHLFDAIVMIARRFSPDDLSTEMIFLIELSKSIIRQETHFLTHFKDPITFNRTITDDEMSDILDRKNIPTTQLVQMISSKSVSEHTRKPIFNYVAKDNVDNFLSTLTLDGKPLAPDEIFSVLNRHFNTYQDNPHAVNFLHTATALVLMEVNAKLHFTNHSFDPSAYVFIEDHKKFISSNSIEMQLYKKQKERIEQILFPEYSEEKKGKEHLAYLQSMMGGKNEVYSSYNIRNITKYIHSAYDLDYHPDHKTFSKIRNLVSLAYTHYANDTVFANTMNMVHSAHLCAYLELCKDETLKLSKFIKPIQIEAEAMLNKVVPHVTEYSIVMELAARFREGINKRGFVHKNTNVQLYTKIIHNIESSAEKFDLSLLKNFISGLENSIFEEDYTPLIMIVKKIDERAAHERHDPPPEVMFLVQYSDLLLRDKTGYLDKTASITKPLTNEQFHIAIKRNNILPRELAKMILDTAPEYIRTQYVNYVAKSMVDDFLSNVKNATPQSIFNTLEKVYENTRSTESDNYFNAAIAQALVILNSTHPVLDSNFTDAAWHIITQVEEVVSTNKAQYSIYKAAKQIIIKKFSTPRKDKTDAQTNNIAIILAALLLFLFAGYIIYKCKKKPDGKRKSKAVATSNLVIYTPDDERFMSSQTPKTPSSISSVISSPSSEVSSSPSIKILSSSSSSASTSASASASTATTPSASSTPTDQTSKVQTTTKPEDPRADFEEMVKITHNKKIDRAELREYTKQVAIFRNSNDEWFKKSNAVQLSEFITQLKRHISEESDIISQLNKNSEVKSSPQSTSTHPKTETGLATEIDQGANADDSNYDESLIPNFLYINLPNEPAEPAAIQTKQEKKTEVIAAPTQKNKKIELILNPKFARFASDVKAFLDEATAYMGGDYRNNVVNRAYKFLIIQFFSAIATHRLPEESATAFKSVRDELCHNWTNIRDFESIQGYLFNILRLIEQTRNGSLNSLHDLYHELSLYDPQIIDLNREWEDLYVPKEQAEEKLRLLIQEFDELKSNTNQSISLQTLASADILAEIGETLRYSSPKMFEELSYRFILLRNKAYHHHEPIPEMMIQAVADLKTLKQYLKIHDKSPTPARKLSFT